MVTSSEHIASINGGNAEHNHAISMWVCILHVGPSAPSTSGGSSVCESDSSHVSDFTTENISKGSEAEVQSLPEVGIDSEALDKEESVFFTS